MIDQRTIDQIIDTANIKDVISEFVTLRRAGVNWKGLCPFHNEKTPSFVVSPTKGLFKCFGCGKGGNVVHFIMQHEQLTYPEALRWLARKYHIEIEEKELSEEEKQARNARENMLTLNQFARDYFRQTMREHPDGRAYGLAYFRSRKLRDDIIEKFELGYSLEERDAFARTALTQGFNKEYLLKTGLCGEHDGNLYDRFRGRVMYPILSLTGNVIGFGGRVLKKMDNVGKYLNSPESEVYHKSDTLYGLYFAKQSIVREDRCILTEGYMDVISMVQSGIENVVASSGTSLTEDQIRLIHRFTNNITVLYDGDSAGIHASLRGIDMLLSEGMNVKVLLLPDGQDPDDFAHAHTSAEYKAYIAENQTDFIRFKTELLMKDAGDDPLKRAQLIQSVIKSISCIPDPIVRTMYVKECVHGLGVEEQLIVSTIQKLRKEVKEEEIIARKREKARQQAAQTSPADALPTPSVQPVTDTAETSADIARAAQQDGVPVLLLTKERMLVRIIVRYGNNVMYEEEDDQGQTYPVTVTNYIQYCMQENEVQFADPTDRLILEEAAKYTHNPNFDSERHFLTHPDPSISCLAAELASDRYQLSKAFTEVQQVPSEEEELYKTVPHLMRDYNLELVKEETKKVLKELQNPANQQDQAKCMQLMQRYKALSTVENKLNKQLGGRVMNI